MQTQLITSNNQLTMSSREIAELTGKRHDNVKSDIEKLLKDLNLSAPEFSGTYIATNGNKALEYNLPKRECLILISGYSVALRAKIIDRWQELENKNYYIPQTYSEALQLCADQAKEIELLNDKNKELSTNLKSANDTIQKNGDTMYYLARILHNREEDKKDIKDLYK